MVYIPFASYFVDAIQTEKFSHQRMNPTDASAGHQGGWRGWDRTSDRLINSQLIYH
jgi:hypothetical protein